MGEDIDKIKSLKNLLIFLKGHGWIPDINREINVNQTIESIENLLQDYTRQKQINEEHQKINGELREKVKELEEERNTYRKQLNDVFSRGFIHKDKIKEQIDWLDNDIKNTKRKIAEEQIYYDDIRKVRLKAYCTKSNEIKNRLKELLGEE